MPINVGTDQCWGCLECNKTLLALSQWWVEKYLPIDKDHTHSHYLWGSSCAFHLGHNPEVTGILTQVLQTSFPVLQFNTWKYPSQLSSCSAPAAFVQYPSYLHAVPLQRLWVGYSKHCSPNMPMPLKSVAGLLPWKPISCHCLLILSVSSWPGMRLFQS